MLHQTMHVIRLLIKFIDLTMPFNCIRINFSREEVRVLHSTMHVYDAHYAHTREAFNVHATRAREEEKREEKRLMMDRKIHSGFNGFERCAWNGIW